MIRSESEYQQSLKRLSEQDEFIERERRRLRAEKHTAAEIKHTLQPVRFFRSQIQAEVDGFERLKRGEFSEIRNLHGLGEILIGLRIYSGMTQRDLAERLGCHETQVSRDERNEYHGITLERAQRILDVFGVDLRAVVRPRERITA